MTLTFTYVLLPCRRLYSGVVINQVGLEAVKELFGTTLKKEKSAVVRLPPPITPRGSGALSFFIAMFS